MKRTEKLDEDANKFIMELEISAKRILKVANKRDLENRGSMLDTHPTARKREKESWAEHNTLPSLRSFTKTGSVLVTAGKAISSSTAPAAMLLTQSSDNLFPLKESATTRPVPGDAETTRHLQYSIPKMTVSMSADLGKVSRHRHSTSALIPGII